MGKISRGQKAQQCTTNAQQRAGDASSKALRQNKQARNKIRISLMFANAFSHIETVKQRDTAPNNEANH
jgi:hypothetical protein